MDLSSGGLDVPIPPGVMPAASAGAEINCPGVGKLAASRAAAARDVPGRRLVPTDRAAYERDVPVLRNDRDEETFDATWEMAG